MRNAGQLRCCRSSLRFHLFNFMTRTVQGRKFGQNGGPPFFKARHLGNQPIPLLYLLFNDTELCSALRQKLLLLRAELAYVLKPSGIGKPIPP